MIRRPSQDSTDNAEDVDLDFVLIDFSLIELRLGSLTGVNIAEHFTSQHDGLYIALSLGTSSLELFEPGDATWFAFDDFKR